MRKRRDETCYGKEYIDTDGVVCQFQECLVRNSCKNVFTVAHRVAKAKADVVVKSADNAAIQREYFAATKKAAYERVRAAGRDWVPHAKGYKKPTRLPYIETGVPRDVYLRQLVELFKIGFACTLSKNCVGWKHAKTKAVAVRACLRRKNSILVYIPDALSDSVYEIGLSCRGMFDSERAFITSALMWVVEIASEDAMRKFILCAKRHYDI